MISSQHLSYSAKKALAKGVVAGVAMMSVYILVVIVTTPSLPASASIKAALDVNSIIIAGTSTAVGAQVFFSSYGKSLGCRLSRSGVGGGSGGTALGSFFSFFSLVPLGCCGSWLFILSLLPSVFGSTLSGFLIQYSTTLSYIALTATLGLAAVSGIKLRRRIKGD